MLVVICGLPGTGKTTVADVVARSVRAVRVSVDVIEDALRRSGLPASWDVGVAAYEAGAATAGQNLSNALTVVADAVNDSEAARGTWRSAAARAGTDVIFVVLEVADPQEHRHRLEGRPPTWTHVRSPTWEDVLQRATRSEPWSGQDHLVLDATAPVDQVAARVLAHLRAG